jgi:hypothetical protein
MKMKRNGIAAIALALAVMLAIPLGPLVEDVAAQQQPPAPAASPQVQQPPDAGVNWSGVGYGAGAVFGNVLYIPAKFVYAFLGAFVGGATWLITAGNTQTADTVWRSSLGGDYVLTPKMIAGQEPINFSGPTQTEAAVPAGAPTSSSSIAPITPLPATSSAAPVSLSGAPAGGGQPMDNGAGPVGGAAHPSSSIE